MQENEKRVQNVKLVEVERSEPTIVCLIENQTDKNDLYINNGFNAKIRIPAKSIYGPKPMPLTVLRHYGGKVGFKVYQKGTKEFDKMIEERGKTFAKNRSSK